MLKKTILLFLVIVIFVLAMAVFKIVEVKEWLHTPLGDGQISETVEIPSGTTLRGSLKILAQKGLIKETELLPILSRLEKLPDIQAGEFEFNDSQSPLEMLEVMAKGKVKLYRFTVPEGLRIEEIATIVEKAGFGKASDFNKIAKSKAYAKKMGIPAENVEGYLLPETYSFPKNTNIDEVIDTMVKSTLKIFGEKEKQRAQSFGMSVHDVITLASIVEKEAAVASERKTISSVYHNRIKKGMLLQADPTIIYGLKNYNGNIRKKDITDPHPWNTYVHKGLPKGPIANPGADSIRATLDPEKTAYLFFVSKNNGSHHFSRTYGEHNRMVQKYQVRGEVGK